MAWITLTIAGLLEVAWAFFMKKSDGFSRLGPSVATLVLMGASFALLAWAMRSLPLSTAYMVWTGIGAVGAFIVGVTVLGEPLSAMRASAAILIISGLVMMRAAG